METSPDRTRRSGGHARPGPLLRTRDPDAAPGRHRAPVTASRQGARARTRPLSARPASLAAGAAGVAVLLVGGWAVLAGGDDTRGATGRASGPVAPTAAAPAATAPAGATSAPPTPAAAPPPSAAVAAAVGPDRTVADARAALEEQLATRADASAALLRATWARDEPAATAAARVVAAASGGVSDVVTAWRDATVAAQVRTGFDQQTAASREYAAAVTSGDVLAADRARARMGEVSRELGTLLAGLTSGRIAEYVPAQDAARYRAFVDALQAGDVADADETARWLRARLTREGAALAAGLGDSAA